MHEFSPDETRRWDTWQRANAVRAKRSDRICRMAGVMVFTATLVALAIAVWLR